MIDSILAAECCAAQSEAKLFELGRIIDTRVSKLRKTLHLACEIAEHA
jgi:hypothetical protein